MVLFLWCFYSSVCFRVALVPTCTSSGGCLSTSPLKLHLDSRTCAWTTGTGPSLHVKGGQKAWASITLPSVAWTVKTCRQFPGRALHSELKNSIPSSSIWFSQGPCMNHSATCTLKCLHCKSSNNITPQARCFGTTAGSLWGAPSYTCVPLSYRSLGKTLAKDSMRTPFWVFDHRLKSDTG